MSETQGQEVKRLQALLDDKEDSLSSEYIQTKEKLTQLELDHTMLKTTYETETETHQAAIEELKREKQEALNRVSNLEINNHASVE